jgi:hypothetical protein
MTWKLFNEFFTTQKLLQIITILGATVALKAFSLFG